MNHVSAFVVKSIFFIIVHLVFIPIVLIYAIRHSAYYVWHLRPLIEKKDSEWTSWEEIKSGYREIVDVIITGK